MSKHGGTFKLSGETRDLLRENQEFFEGILGLYDPQDPEKIPLKLAARDPESRTEAKIQPGGEVEVSFVLPLDDDADPENGRIYLRDTFVFDPGERKLKSYQRSFDYNGKGQGAWQAWLEKYRASAQSDAPGLDDPKVLKFAFSAGTAFGRRITDENGETLPEFRAAFQREHRYLDTTHHMVAKQWQDLRYKIKDKLNHYTLVHREDRLEVTFHIAIDADDDPANGRLILSDTITVDAKTWEIKKFSRLWRPAPELEGNEEWTALADSMNEMTAGLDAAEKKKLSEEGEAFLRNLAPLLLTGKDMKPEDAWKAALSTPQTQLGPAEPSPLARRFQADPRRGEGTPRILAAMRALADESIAVKHDGQSGWWHRKVLGREPMDLSRAQEALQGVFLKAETAASAQPKATAFEVLKSLPLEGDEANARDRLLEDRLLVELNAIGAEADGELRARGLLGFADQRLFRRAGLVASAQLLLTDLKEDPFVKDKAQEVLETMAGKGSFGNKFEAFLPRFTEQVAHPATLIAMGGAPFLGVAAEGLGLAGLSRAGLLAGLSGRVNWGGRLAAGAFGIGGEALAFTALHQAGQSALHDSARVTEHFAQELYSGVLLFGAMRLAHAGMNPLTARFLAKKPVEGEMLVTPTGRVLLNPRWGGGEPTRLGKAAAPLLNHGSGVVAMHAANSLSRRWGLMPDNGQDGSSHFLDSALSYGQAVLGFNLANRITSGRLQSGLAATKLRLENYRSGLNSSPSSSRAKHVSQAPIGTGVTFRFNGTWEVDARKQKTIWIGSVPGRRKGVEYEDGFARLNIGPEETVSEHHAVLTRDRSDTFWYVGDAGSTYGTYVNGQPLTKGQAMLLKSGFLVQLGDSFQLRIEAEGNLIKPDKSIRTVVELPQAPAQKKLGPPPPAEHFPFETLYPDVEISPDAVAEVAQLRPAKGEIQHLTSKTTSWGKADTAHIYVDAKGRWVLENLNVDSPIEVHRPAREGVEEARWSLRRTDMLSSEEEKAGGRQDWVFLEPGDRIGLGRQIYEFVPHDRPILDSQDADPSRTLGYEGPSPQQRASRPQSAPPDKRPSKPPVEQPLDSEVVDDMGDRPTLVHMRTRELEAENMDDRPTLVNIQPVPRQARPSAESEVTRVRGPRLTEVARVPAFPSEYTRQIPPGMPVFELRAGERLIRGDLNHTSYLIGREPEVREAHQSTIVVPGRLLERIHAEIFLAKDPRNGEYGWVLTDRDSFFGTFLGGSEARQLDAGAKREYVWLRSGSTFSLGAPEGKSDAVEFRFDLPWAPATLESARPASVFPPELARDLGPGEAPMMLVDNFGNSLFSADRQSTRYIFGSHPEPREEPNARTVVFDRPNVDAEHCEIFLDSSGQWYLRSLTVEEGTYLNGRKLLGGAMVALPPNAEIALGGDPVAGHGLTFLFKRGGSAMEKGRDSRPPEALDPETVKPPPAGPKGPPPLPRSSSDELSTTQVMGVQTQEELARRSVELEEAPQPARRPSQPPSPHVIRRSSPSQPRRLPPQPPREAKPAPQPVAKPRDEADFGDIGAEVSGARRPPTPPPTSGLESATVIPKPSPLPRIELPAEAIPAPPLKPRDPALIAMHPKLGSKGLARQIQDWVTATADRESLKMHRGLLKAFPRYERHPHNLAGSTETLPMFFRRLLRPEDAAQRVGRNLPVAALSEATQAALQGLSVFGKTFDLGQVYQMGFDGKTLVYMSNKMEGLNTSLTLNIRPGGEAEMLKGLHERLLKLDVPVEITVPLQVGETVPSYLGILYRAEDAAQVHQAARDFVRNYPDALGGARLPFTQSLRGDRGEALRGVGVMEYFHEDNMPNPLEHRFRAAVIRSHTSYVKPALTGGSYDSAEHLRQSLRYYAEAGYDLENPGFRADSLGGSHRALLPELYPEE